MGYVIDITVKAKAPDMGMMTRILNFKEDLHHLCFTHKDVKVVDAAAVDMAMKPVRFTIRSRKALKPFMHTVERSLAENHLGEVIEILTEKAT